MEPKFDRSFEVAHETRYPIVNKPRAIEFAELFGSVPLKRCLVELCPAQQDRSLPNITLLDPGPRADLETFLSFKDTRRAAAKASGWQAVVNEPRFRAELSEVAASGLVQENPGIAKELDRYNLSPQDREACVDHIRLRYDFLFSWCFEELLMNAAQYGNSGDPNKILEVATGYQHDGHFVFWIKDQGNGYNPSRLPNPTDQELREVPSGRGLYTLAGLVWSLFDEESALEKLFYKTDPVDWPHTISEDLNGTFRIFDAGAGTEVKLGWKKVVRDFVAARGLDPRASL